MKNKKNTSPKGEKKWVLVQFTAFNPFPSKELNGTLSPGEKFLDLQNRGADVLIWSLQHWVSEVIWGLKFQGPKCAIRGLKFGEGDIIWDLIFLVCHCPSHFLGIKFLSKQDS